MTQIAGNSGAQERDKWQALWRGFKGRCPKCGEGKIFRAYLKVNDTCPSCGEELFHQRADDAPPYFTIMIVGHIIGGGMLYVEEVNDNLPLWIHMAIWPALTVILALTLLPRIKGALVGLQWALRMHGFGEAETPAVLARA